MSGYVNATGLAALMAQTKQHIEEIRAPPVDPTKEARKKAKQERKLAAKEAAAAAAEAAAAGGNASVAAADEAKVCVTKKQRVTAAAENADDGKVNVNIGGKKQRVTPEEKIALIRSMRDLKQGKRPSAPSVLSSNAEATTEADDMPIIAPKAGATKAQLAAAAALIPPTIMPVVAVVPAKVKDDDEGTQRGKRPRSPATTTATKTAPVVNYKATPATNAVWVPPSKRTEAPATHVAYKKPPVRSIADIQAEREEQRTIVPAVVIPEVPVVVTDADVLQEHLMPMADGDDPWSRLPGGGNLEMLLHKKLLRGLQKAVPGVTRLTGCQAEAFPHISKPKTDVLIRSETGSGKTIAYALPLMNQLLKSCDVHPIDRSAGTLIVVMVPTRELSLQVCNVFLSLTTTCQFIVVGSVHGGEDKHKEKSKLRKGLHILVATPGRLVDHLQTTNAFQHHNLQSLVLDEADRLLDMGFEHSIHLIMDKLRASQRKVLVSATITKAVERLTHFALSNPVRVGKTEDVFEVPKTLTQYYAEVGCKHRLETLVAFLLSEQKVNRKKKIVVFMSTSDATEFHYFLLSRAGNPFAAIRKEKIATIRREALASNATIGSAAPPAPMATIAGAAGGEKAGEAAAAAVIAVNTAPGMHAPAGPRKQAKKLTMAANQHLDDLSGGGRAGEDVVNFDAEESDDDSETEEANNKRAADAIEKQKKIQGGNDKPESPLFESNLFKLHGNMSQVDRASVFHSFKTCETGILFATDVAARGLDMPAVDWVVHYDPPSDERCYIHRVGRTARIGRIGCSLLFLQPAECEPYLAMLKTYAAISNSEVQKKTTDPILYHLSRMDRGRSDWNQSAGTLHKSLCSIVKNDEHVQRVAVYAYRAFIRAYAAYPRAVKHVFQSANLHLGHVAHSFAIDKAPAEIERTMRFSKHVAEERTIGQRQIRVGGREGRGLEGRVQIDNSDNYHSTLLQKQAKKSRDFLGQKLAEGAFVKPSYSEFDA